MLEIITQILLAHANEIGTALVTLLILLIKRLTDKRSIKKILRKHNVSEDVISKL
jgi:hypothetical protein